MFVYLFLQPQSEELESDQPPDVRGIPRMEKLRAHDSSQKSGQRGILQEADHHSG